MCVVYVVCCECCVLCALCVLCFVRCVLCGVLCVAGRLLRVVCRVLCGVFITFYRFRLTTPLDCSTEVKRNKFTANLFARRVLASVATAVVVMSHALGASRRVHLLGCCPSRSWHGAPPS